MNLLICAHGRSGSTLLDLLLGSHAGFLSLGEISHLPKNLVLDSKCSCGQPFSTCSYWQRALGELQENHGLDLVHPYTFRLGLPRSAREVDRKQQTSLYLLRRQIINLSQLAAFIPGISIPAYRRYAARSLKLYETLLTLNGDAHTIDSSKESIRAAAIYRKDPGNTRIILLTRDGRAVLHSMMKNRKDIVGCVKGWVRFYQQMLWLLDRLIPDEHIVRISYESLISDPEATLQKIFTAFNLDVSEISGREFSNESHILNGNDMRKTSTITIRNDDSWKQGLTPEMLEVFKRYGSAINQKLGYEI